jgi:hypothetical protein
MTKKQEHENLLIAAFRKVKLDADKIWELVSDDIIEEEAILNLQGKPAIFKNTITVLQGKTGTHKSRLAGSLVSLLVSDNPSMELFGFSKGNLDNCLVIYADTERNIQNQLPIALKQILKDSKIEINELKERLIIFPLNTSSRVIRTELMGRQFAQLPKVKDDHSQISVVIFLDIISDLVLDFNNVINTLELTDIINSAINLFNITFIVTIHENPGIGEKARGHLGTELSNKASTIFQMANTNKKDIFSLKMIKSRTTEKYDDVLLKYDSSINNLVVVSDLDTIKQVSNPNTIRLGRALEELNRPRIVRKELIEYLEKALKWKERKIEDELKLFIDNGIEFESFFGRTILTKTRGKTVEYQMEFLGLPPSAEGVDESKYPEVD